MPRRVLVTSVSAGAGHLRAAQAITEALARSHPDILVNNVDTMDYSRWPFRHIYAGFYLGLVARARILWSWLYARTYRQPPSARMARLSRAIERLGCRPLGEFAKAFGADEIVCVHPLPLHVLGELKRRGELSGRLSVVLTDFDLHLLWLHPQVDRYFVSCEEMAFLMESCGAERGKITVTGIPIVPPFAEPVSAEERARLRAGLGLPENRPAVLFSTGGFGVGKVAESVEAVLRAAARAAPAGVIVVAGRNEALRARLAALTAPQGVKLVVFGLVNNMHELMAAADLSVSKPGGLTCSESLARELPTVLLDPIPGQEEHNAAHLLEKGVAWQASDVAMIEYKVGRLLAAPEQLAAMRAAARRIARPRAAFVVADAVAKAPPPAPAPPTPPTPPAQPASAGPSAAPRH